MVKNPHRRPNALKHYYRRAAALSHVVFGRIRRTALQSCAFAASRLKFIDIAPAELRFRADLHCEVTAMVHSMTAFARVEKAGAQGTLSWELRSVNSRYLEPHLRLPESFRELEGAVREALRQGLSRGKLECTLRFTEESTGKPLQVDRERAAQLVAAAETIAGLIKNPAALNPLEVLAWPGVLVADASDPQALNAEALALFNQGLKELKAGREREARSWHGCNDRLTSIEEDVVTCVNWFRRCSPPSARRSSTALPT